MQHRSTAAPQHRNTANRGFTLVEILSAIMIIAILTTVIGVFVSSAKSMAQKVSDQKTLETLNDALTRYKGEGGNVAALTAGTPIPHAIARLQTQVTWAGLTHQFLQTAFTKPARSIFAKGTGATFRFSGFNTYTSESGGTSIQGVLARIYLTTTGAGTWTVPSDWNSGNNRIECIGGGGNGDNAVHGSAGGGGAYSLISNLTLTPGTSASYQVGAAAGDTFFNGASFGASSCAAKGGASASGLSGGQGGQSGSGVGTTKYSGGNGGQTGSEGGGGGGAGGPHGNGGNGGTSPGVPWGGGGGGAGGGSNGDTTAGTGGNNWSGSGGGAGGVGAGGGSAGTNGGGGGAATWQNSTGALEAMVLIGMEVMVQAAAAGLAQTLRAASADCMAVLAAVEMAQPQARRELLSFRIRTEGVYHAGSERRGRASAHLLHRSGYQPHRRRGASEYVARHLQIGSIGLPSTFLSNPHVVRFRPVSTSNPNAFSFFWASSKCSWIIGLPRIS